MQIDVQSFSDQCGQSLTREEMDSDELDYVGVFDGGKETAFLGKLLCYPG